MREMSLCEEVLQVLEAQARARRFARVRRVRLEVGALAHVEPEAVRFSFDAVTRGTVAQGASLEIVPVAGEAWCGICGQAVPVTQRYDECPHCSSVLRQLTRGDELRIKDLEVE